MRRWGELEYAHLDWAMPPSTAVDNIIDLTVFDGFVPSIATPADDDPRAVAQIKAPELPSPEDSANPLASCPNDAVCLTLRLCPANRGPIKNEVDNVGNKCSVDEDSESWEDMLDALGRAGDSRSLDTIGAAC